MIQGGGFDADMQQKETREPIENEADNGLKNDYGTIAMARTMDPHSATAQFFINHADNAFLDHPGQDGWGYAVFGKVVDGMDTVAKALERMLHVDTKSLIVRKRHNDDEYGMVLISHIARQVLAQDRAPERVNIYEIMSKPLLNVAPSMDIRYCARLFSKLGFSHAPVIDNGKLMGMVSYSQLVLKGLC